MSIRKLTRYQIGKLLRDSGVTQAEIAAAVGVTQAFVSRVISRSATVRPSAKTEAVWRTLERRLGRVSA